VDHPIRHMPIEPVGCTGYLPGAPGNRVELGGFTDEQAMQRRVAALVARGRRRGKFAAVVEEVGGLLAVDHTVLTRYMT
jgi:hypothetical protein